MDASGKNEIITIRGLNKTFGSGDTAVTALSGIDLTIYEGEIFGIIGLSGAGKSTLVRCMNHLEKPTDGSVVIAGQALEKLQPGELLAARRNMGMIFQQFNLLMQKNAIQNICFPLEIAGVPKAQAVKRARELLEVVERLNQDETVDGILVQLPLPKQIDEKTVLRSILPEKDVDGFHPENVGRLSLGLPGFVSCTPAGVMELLRRYDLSPAGKKAVVVGRSDIVGKPLAMLLARPGDYANATVTICHSRTPDLAAECRNADFLFLAMGRPRFVTADMVREGVVVIDVGINRGADGKLHGDVNFEEASAVAGYITPVPGGVGPMTRAMLMKNTTQAAAMQNGVAI